jgi:hypothetical protein
MAKSIIPHFKLLIRYNVKLTTNEDYFQFVINEFVPAMQELGLYMVQVYHTAYGDYPLRQLEFVAEDLETVRKAMNSEAWKQLHAKLDFFISDYDQKLVKFRDGFQF